MQQYLSTFVISDFFMQRYIELLAPARTAEIGIEAFRYGADAVYIGAPAFSARAAAGNSVEDIARLAAFGHQYGAKTIVAFNTILTDNELPQAEKLIWELYEAGIDALIIQDLGLLQLNLPPIELHASTQTDNRTIEKVKLMHDLGMTRVVMARELSVNQISEIHQAVPDVELECFIHGALCVSFSGQCYLSAALTGRSANRGECAQPCRLPMELYGVRSEELGARSNSTKEILLARDKHLLSLRDMNRSEYVEQLIEAGVTSLKIEGRLKDVTYVKNVVAYYRKLIDALLEKHPDWQSVSEGRCTYNFEPKLDKSFNRGFTSYFANGEREPMWNFSSPKSQGEYIGKIGRIYRDCFELPHANLNNGDGMYVGGMGFRLNRYDRVKGLCYPLAGQKVCQLLQKGDDIYRNMDLTFEKNLEHAKVFRKIPVNVTFRSTPEKLMMSMQTKPEDRIVVEMDVQLEMAQQRQEQSISKTISKLGDTPFELATISFENEQVLFVPNSLSAEIKRQAVDALMKKRENLLTASRKAFLKPDYKTLAKGLDARGILPTSYLANVLNKKARETYADMHIEKLDDAFECQHDKQGMVMQTKHCLKYAFGQCPRFKNPSPEKLLVTTAKLGQQAMLKIGNRKFILKFGCNNDCISEIFTIFAPQK